MKNTQTPDFCADQIDVTTNFAIITNVVIKRVHCIAYSFIVLSNQNSLFVLMCLRACISHSLTEMALYFSMQ